MSPTNQHQQQLCHNHNKIPKHYLLAYTKISLRSALFQPPEWWPLVMTTSIGTVSMNSGVLNQQASQAPSVFFHKTPSMDYIGNIT